MGEDSGNITVSNLVPDEPHQSRQVAEKEIKAALSLKLPRTPSELRAKAIIYQVYQDYSGLSDNYKYKRWCIFVPDPLMTKAASERTEKITNLIKEMREGIGSALGKEALFLTIVKQNGDLDLGVAGHILNVLQLERKDFPILIICEKPLLRITTNITAKGNFTEDDKPDLIVVKFRGSTTDEVRRTITLLQRELAKGDSDLTATKISMTRFGIRLLLAAGNIGKTTFDAGKVAAPIILAYFGGKK